MKKRSKAKKIARQEINCSWFDSQNARLVILCATLGIFGAHKFAQRKYFQGFLYILLDLTVFGIILTLILSWLDLIFLTAKSDNRPGNMILGSIFIILESFIFMPGYDLVIKNINQEPKDSAITVVEPDDKNVDAKDAAVTDDVVGEESEMPVLLIDDGEVPAKVTVQQDNIVLTLESDKSNEPVKIITTEDNADNDNVKTKQAVMWVDNVKESAKKTTEETKDTVGQSKKQHVKKPAKKSEELAKGEQEDASDEFGSFSLYGMIAGE